MRASLGRTEIELGPPKQRSILALLALRAQERVPLEDLVGALWGGRPPLSATHLVHTYVARLRQALEPDMPRRHRTHVIGSVSGGYRLLIDGDRLDLRLFRQLTQQARVLLDSQEWERSFDLLGQAVQAWQDPQLGDLAALLPNQDEIGLIRQELVSTGVEYVALGLDHGRAGVVLPVAKRLAQVEPLNETVQAQYLLATARTGQRAVAVDQYAQVRARLRVELGVDPSPQLTTAYREVLDARDTVDGSRVATTAPHDRPAWRGPGPTVDELVGRQSDMTHLLHLLNRHRLVTLTGPYGVGKTALALALAELTQDGFADGVAVVELSAARCRSDLVKAAGGVLGRPYDAPGCSAEVLLDRLAEQNQLLVFDNAELAVDDTAKLIDEVLRGCPKVSVVVTSQELLGLSYEAVHPVRPMAVDDPPSDGERLDQVPAVQLFARRAAQVCPGFRLTQLTTPLVAAVCRQLDGLPLAIELAAACLRTGPLRRLLDRLDDPLHAIRPPRRGGPSHHGSLHAAVHRSFELLNAAEQRCFASLGVLTGEFCVEAARVARGDPADGEKDVQVLLDRLVDKSILEVRHGEPGPRYRMLRTIRALAREMAGRWGDAERRPLPVPCVAGCRCFW